MKRKYDTAEELQAAIDQYFTNCQEREKNPTFSGLAYALGFLQRQSLNQYADRDDELSIPIKRAGLFIESCYEEQLQSNSCTGAIFALKNRGWSDKQEIEHSGKADLNIKVEYVG